MKVFFSSWLYLLSSSHSKGSILTGLDSIAAESIAGDSRTARSFQQAWYERKQTSLRPLQLSVKDRCQLLLVANKPLYQTGV
ncbi:hypothetical protein V6N12_028567 [Hibiscus sabdariffa]|uniref:Uncharacterized protein n=1 Tax=Hibiscus sabdariffa TaxID=183260 RepID=A0ABR2F679_9ROSI